MKLLLHICCANCSLYPIRHLSEKGIDLKGLWFNPNIHPDEEYKRRLSTLKRLEQSWSLDIEYINYYGLRDFLKAIEVAGLKDTSTERCAMCYSMRLEKTAETAKNMVLDGFTTTLLVSPYQRFELIAQIGHEIAKRYSIPFYLEDLRGGYREGLRLGGELGLYRQKYCGCIFSKEEWTRFSSKRDP